MSPTRCGGSSFIFPPLSSRPSRPVVPANAGTHTPRQLLLKKVSNTSVLTDGPRRMAPPMRNCASEVKPGTTAVFVVDTIIQNALSRSRDALRPSFARSSLPSKTEGAGKTGCALHPRSRVRIVQRKLHTSIQGSGEHPAFPAQWLYGLCRDLPGDEFLVDSVAAVPACASPTA